MYTGIMDGQGEINDADKEKGRGYGNARRTFHRSL
jgi:hypothetical protein